jgi:hypothetical protein
MLLPHCDEAQIDVQHPKTPYPLACRDFTGDPNFGLLVAMHSLPLLGIPISYAIREATRPAGVQLALRVGSLTNGFSLQIQGVF